MATFKKLQAGILVFILMFFFSSKAYSAAPDGLDPWADSVVSAVQGLMKNALPVPAERSDSASAIGVAEEDTVSEHFFSLGFGGVIVLGFDNGISSGVFVVESTNPGYPLEEAKIELSEDGTVWTEAGTVLQDGTVNVPDGVTCAKFARITDISDPTIFPDEVADGFDVDGVQAIGDSCTLEVTPPAPPPPSPSPSGGGGGGGGSPSPSPSGGGGGGSFSGVPGFPDTGSGEVLASCISSGISTIPKIIEAKRIDPTSVFVSWGPDEGWNNFVVQFGSQAGTWQFSTKASGFSTTLTGLPSGEPIWVQVAATDNCLIGTFGERINAQEQGRIDAPGDSSTANAFIPRLPNAGMDPNAKSMPGTAGAGAFSFAVLYIARRTYKFLLPR